MKKLKNKTQGFTLVELMLALAIISFVTATVWTTIFAVSNTKDKVEARDDFEQSVRVVLDRINSDISQAFFLTGARKRTGFIGEAEKLTFSTFSHDPVDPTAPECESTLITYSLDRDPERLALYTLKRKENKRLKDDFTEDEGKAIDLLGGINSLKFEYYDGERFTDRWNHESLETKQKDKIPRAVKVDLDVKDNRNTDHHYYTMINLFLSRIEPTFFNPPSVQTGGSGKDGKTGTDGEEVKDGGTDTKTKTPTPSASPGSSGTGEESEQ